MGISSAWNGEKSDFARAPRLIRAMFAFRVISHCAKNVQLEKITYFGRRGRESARKSRKSSQATGLKARAPSSTR